MASSLRMKVSFKDDTSRIAQLDNADKQVYLRGVIRELEKLLAGESSGSVALSIDSETEVAASVAIACTQASATAGDKLVFTLPDGTSVVLTASASPTVAEGTFSIATSDTVMAASIVAAVNAYPPAAKWLSATESPSGTALVAYKFKGAEGNTLKVRKVVTTAGVFAGISATNTSFSGGREANDQSSATATCVQASIVADDTVVIGSVTLTWKASAASEDEVDIGADDEESNANLAAAINAHSVLGQIIIATASSTAVTLKYWCAGREGDIISLAETGGGVTLSATALSSTLTSATSTSRREFMFGVPSASQ